LLGEASGFILKASPFWLIVEILFIGGSIVAFVQYLGGAMFYAANWICPIKWLGFATICIFALIRGISFCYAMWTSDVHYSGWLLFKVIVLTAIVVYHTAGIIFGSLLAELNKLTNRKHNA
jgi:hypothetical protein